MTLRRAVPIGVLALALTAGVAQAGDICVWHRNPVGTGYVCVCRPTPFSVDGQPEAYQQVGGLTVAAGKEVKSPCPR